MLGKKAKLGRVTSMTFDLDYKGQRFEVTVRPLSAVAVTQEGLREVWRKVQKGIRTAMQVAVDWNAREVSIPARLFGRKRRRR